MELKIVSNAGGCLITPTNMSCLERRNMTGEHVQAIVLSAINS